MVDLAIVNPRETDTLVDLWSHQAISDDSGAPTSWALEDIVSSATPANVDADANDELIVATSQAVSAIHFLATPCASPIATDGDYEFVEAADLDADGVDELVVGNAAGLVLLDPGSL